MQGMARAIQNQLSGDNCEEPIPMDYPIRIYVRFMPAAYGIETLEAGATFNEAKRRLKPYLKRGLRCAVCYKDHAVYLEPDCSTVEGPLPYGGVAFPLEDELRG